MHMQPDHELHFYPPLAQRTDPPGGENGQTITALTHTAYHRNILLEETTVVVILVGRKHGV